ncbi:AAA family ATPase [Microcoleus sp. AT9_B5]
MTISPIEELNAAIQSYNPFPTGAAVVREQDVWEQGFPDVRTLNAHASDAVYQAIDRVYHARSAREKVTSMVVIAGKGVGKSHVISRIHHRLKADGSALFIYAGVETYDIKFVNYYFLQTLADSLNHNGSQEVTQWQELAAAMVNQVGINVNSDAETIPAKKVVEKYSQAENNNWVDELVAKYRRIKRSDPDIIRAIFWTLSEDYSDFAVKWLSGKNLAEVRANAMGLPNPSTEDKYQNAEAFKTISQILSLVSEYKPLVICFDELDLDNRVDPESGLTRPLAIAGLIKPLVDDIQVSDKSKGFVILTVMMPETWTNKIKLMPGGVVDRVSRRGDPIPLKFMDGDSIIQLVSLWMEEFYQSRNLISHSPIYPFEENQLRDLGKNSDSSVRRVLTWCSENFKTLDVVAPQPPEDLVEIEYNKALISVENSITTLLEEKITLADALWLSFSTIIGQTLENVKINSLEKIRCSASEKSYSLDFKIIGEENGNPVKIGVMVLQIPSGMGVQAGLKRLIDYQKFKITRGCLVRSKEINSGATKAQGYLNELLSPHLGGEWVKLTGDNIKTLLAIRSVYCSRENYDFTEAAIFDFLARKKLIVNNYIICEILSNPSGQIPSNLSKE